MIGGTPAICIASSTAFGTAVAATTTQTTLCGAGGIGTIPGGILQVGSIIRAKVRGIVSTPGASPGTLTFSLVIGAATASNLGATPTLQTSGTNITFEVDIEARVNAVGTGTSANIIATARANASGVFATTPGLIMLPASGAPTAGTGFDSTVSNKIDIQVAWSLNTAGCTIQATSTMIELFP